MKTKRKIFLILFILVLIAAMAAAAWLVFLRMEMANAPEPGDLVQRFLDRCCAEDWQGASELITGMTEPQPEKLPETESGKLLYEALCASWSGSAAGECETSFKKASQKVTISYLDPEKLSEGLDTEINAVLARMVDEAALASEIYNEDKSYKNEALQAAFYESLSTRCAQAEQYRSEIQLDLKLEYKEDMWRILNGDELSKTMLAWADTEADAMADKLFASAAAEPVYVPKHYTIEEKALSGPVPLASNFGETDDPSVIEALLNTPEAAALIGDRTLVWNAEIELIPDTVIRYYLDETILVLVWQEEEAQAVGTFSEVIIADGSQIRRKIAGDEYQSFDFKTTTEFSQLTNGVLTLGGDFYHHDRSCGVVVYDRQILRFDPDTCDTCYVTAAGDLLFSYRGQFQEWEEAQAFVDENDILYSLCFGPVLIDNGQDVTPEQYQWGEINDTYARSALGLIDPLHYLTMNINCQQPGYYYLATLRQAADAMIEKGCVKAYTLDGGQTATTVFNGQLINPVQFGWEKPISDVIYFATALPEAAG